MGDGGETSSPVFDGMAERLRPQYLMAMLAKNFQK